jgi:hypothetical protein
MPLSKQTLDHCEFMDPDLIKMLQVMLYLELYIPQIKMRITSVLVGLLASVMLLSGTLAQTDPSREVQTRYAECNALEKVGKPLEFQRAQAGNDLGAWEQSKPKQDIYERMRVHLASNRVRSVRLEETSASDDWFSVTTYCFRVDGTLAFKFQTLRTVNHDVVPGLSRLDVELRSFFSPNGKNFKNLEKMRDALINKPVKTTYMLSGGPDFPTSSSVIKAVGAELPPAK